MPRANDIDETTASGESSRALLPRVVRRWVLGGLAVLVLAACYLIAVRGTVILFDMADAVKAFCF